MVGWEVSGTTYFSSDIVMNFNHNGVWMCMKNKMFRSYGEDFKKLCALGLICMILSM